MIKQIEKLINDFNNGWTKGEIESITPILHENIVFVAPDLKTEIIGKDNCIQTIIDYISSGETKLFEITEMKIHVIEQTAIIILDYYVEYEMNNRYYKENGKEFWTLIEKDGNWQLVWRAMVMNEKVE